MAGFRIIPVLLIKNGGLVKGSKFKDHRYVGDPINAVKIFNEKEVDELVILDISATKEKKMPDITQISEIASEAFMPMAYGGGVTDISQVNQIVYTGMEKVIFNTSAFTKPELIRESAKQIGSSSTVISIDVKKNMWGKYKVFVENGTKDTGKDPVQFAKEMQSLGAGEIILNSIDRDGTFSGFDTELIAQVCKNVVIPVIACGGAGTVDDFSKAHQAGASAVAAGAMFVFHGKHRAVLITYPEPQTIQKVLTL
jgi:imidazole glycerol-phosphate synthase subunit HisF